MRATFLDSGVLIAAISGAGEERHAAWEILTDPSRELWTSPFVELEVLPHAERQGTAAAVGYYRSYFKAARAYTNLDRIVNVAAGELRKTNLGMADALHLAAAHLAGVEEFITTEKRTKPMHRNTLVNVKGLR